MLFKYCLHTVPYVNSAHPTQQVWLPLTFTGSGVFNLMCLHLQINISDVGKKGDEVLQLMTDNPTVAAWRDEV
jgi:hypothetical protein